LNEDVRTDAGGSAVVGDHEAAVAELLSAAVRDELDKVVPHIVAALKRDRAFDALAERLRDAERRLEARRERPIGSALLAFLHRLRHLSLDPMISLSLDAEIVRILHQAGFEELGKVGEPFDPAHHEPLEGRTGNGEGRVAEVYATGLASCGEVVVRAQVRVIPNDERAEPTNDPSSAQSDTHPKTKET
jgi:hypothetical protein